MVSLEEKITFQKRIQSSAKLKAFYDLLLGSEVSIPADGLNESDEIFYGVINSLQSNDKTLFETYYNKKNKSNPGKESPSPFVNDDFLIFALITGIAKFCLDKTWISNIISVRPRNSFTVTFENLVDENYYSKNNLPEIVLIYFGFIDSRLISNEFLKTTYKSISQNYSLLESKSDFHILCSLRSYDKIIESIEPNDSGNIGLLKEFNSSFIKRVKTVSWVVQTIILVAILYGAIEFISIKPTVKLFFDKIGSVLKILGLFGISQFGNAFPVLKRKLYAFLLKLFGYPKGLINQVMASQNKK
jgi:hypothetical protein